jgi:hypothetical protein
MEKREFLRLAALAAAAVGTRLDGEAFAGDPAKSYFSQLSASILRQRSVVACCGRLTFTAIDCACKTIETKTKYVNFAIVHSSLMSQLKDIFNSDLEQKAEEQFLLMRSVRFAEAYNELGELMYPAYSTPERKILLLASTNMPENTMIIGILGSRPEPFAKVTVEDR